MSGNRSGAKLSCSEPDAEKWAAQIAGDEAVLLEQVSARVLFKPHEKQVLKECVE
jgi:hypothetical protein